MTVRRMTSWTLWPESAGTALVAKTSLGMVVGGSLSLVLAKSTGVSPGLLALGGALLGGFGVFAAVAHPRVSPSPWKEEVEEDSAEIPEDWNAARIVAFLREHLGRDLTAFVSGLEQDQEWLVDRWASGQYCPDPLAMGRLRTACRATRWILELYAGETAQAWFRGQNQWFNDEAPAYVLRCSSEPEVWEEIVDAAQAFMGS